MATFSERDYELCLFMCNSLVFSSFDSPVYFLFSIITKSKIFLHKSSFAAEPRTPTPNHTDPEGTGHPPYDGCTRARVLRSRVPLSFKGKPRQGALLAFACLEVARATDGQSRGSGFQTALRNSWGGLWGEPPARATASSAINRGCEGDHPQGPV